MSTEESINGIIYLIHHTDPTKQIEYIGSTQFLAQRKQEHKHTCNNESAANFNIPLYKTIREHGGFDNFAFEVLEYNTCANKTELRKIEQEWIDVLKPCMNATRAYSPPERVAALRRLNKKKNQAIVVNCGCGLTFNQSNHCRHVKSKCHIAWLATGKPNGHFGPTSEVCTLCGGHYSGPTNKWKHDRTARHLQALAQLSVD